MIFNIFLRLFKVFAGFNSVEQTTPQYCRNWNGVDPETLPKLYSFVETNDYFIDKSQCPLECLDFQFKTQKYFNASRIPPYPRASELFSELCTIPVLPNKACYELAQLRITKKLNLFFHVF